MAKLCLQRAAITGAHGRAGAEHMSEAELAISQMVATTRVEMEQIAARCSEGTATPEDIDLYNRLAGNLRRHLEALGLERRALPVNGPLTLAEISARIKAERRSGGL
jgi:hypothetical protein